MHMIGLLLAPALVAQQPADDPASALCKTALERKAHGQIATFQVASSHARHGTRTIEGRLTAFQGMGRPAPGMASTHHLIRADSTFRCRIVHGRVREARLNPL